MARLGIDGIPAARLIGYQPNKGKGFAVRTGVLASKGQWIVFLDADLSTPIEELEKLYKEEKSIEGKIVSRIKGGMMVDIGVKAFLPGSQIDLHPVRDLDGLVGKTFPLKIIKINHRRGNVVVSRRVLLEETRDKKRQTTLATLKEGQLIQGTVKNNDIKQSCAM